MPWTGPPGRSCGTPRFRVVPVPACRPARVRCTWRAAMVRCTPSDSRWSTKVRRAAVVIAAWLSAPRAAAQLPDGPGRSETVRLCSRCHAAEVVMSVGQDRAGWAATLRKMSALGATGTDEEFRIVLGYLATHFPAQELPPINVNTATAIELESGLSLRRSQAAAIIAYRLQHGAFKSLEDLEKVPGLDVAKIAAKRDRIAF